jgi:hypothetical protein
MVTAGFAASVTVGAEVDAEPAPPIPTPMMSAPMVAMLSTIQFFLVIFLQSPC